MTFRILNAFVYVPFLSGNQFPYNRSRAECGKMAVVTHDYVNWYQYCHGLQTRQRPRLTLGKGLSLYCWSSVTLLELLFV